MLRVGGESHPQLGVELAERVDHAAIALGNQLRHRHAIVAVFGRGRDDIPQVRSRQQIAGLTILKMRENDE